MATTYCTDTDLTKYRPNILSLGVTDWSDQRQEAYDYINRFVEAKWYRDAAVKMGYDPDQTRFDPEYVKEGELKRLECYKTLEFAYMHLMKESVKGDGFERNMQTFAKLFADEFNVVLSIGIQYDWSGDGEFSDEEIRMPYQRRLSRG